MADVDETSPRDGQTYLQRVKQGEQHALWKLALRTVCCVLDIIAIGAAAWTLANALKVRSNPYIGYFSGPEVSPWVLLVSGLSFIFCLVCVLILLLRRPPKAAHPGMAVGCDLVLWLAFIVTALFATAAIFSVASFGNNGDTLSDPSYPSDYDGEYYLNKPNNTWLYNITYVYPQSTTSSSTTGLGTGYGTYFYNTTRGTYQLNTTLPSPSSVHRDCTPRFATCAEQDAYINSLWHSRDQRLATEVLTGVTQWLLVLLHFVLFVWACVDTHRRNRERKLRKDGVVAERVIREMEARGLITVHANATPAEGLPLMGESRGGGSGGMGSGTGTGHR